jgi:hypothetical protein
LPSFAPSAFSLMQNITSEVASDQVEVWLSAFAVLTG